MADMIWTISFAIFGALWRRYYGGWTNWIVIHRVTGKWGTIAILFVILLAALFMLTKHWSAIPIALLASLMWFPGFGDWGHFGTMFCRYTAWTASIATLWTGLTGDLSFLWYAPFGLIGVLYPALNRVKEYVPGPGYTEWCEWITGAVLIGGLIWTAGI